MEFEWDAAKARSNARKHGVTFEEAATVFRDGNGIELFDELHSESEGRKLPTKPINQTLVALSKPGLGARERMIAFSPHGGSTLATLPHGP